MHITSTKMYNLNDYTEGKWPSVFSFRSVTHTLFFYGPQRTSCSVKFVGSPVSTVSSAHNEPGPECTMFSTSGISTQHVLLLPFKIISLITDRNGSCFYSASYGNCCSYYLKHLYLLDSTCIFKKIHFHYITTHLLLLMSCGKTL